MRFPPDFIERLRSHLPLSQVIGKRIPVKKFGREYKALCPFHGEKTPSFTINDEKSFFHCFGCGAHGDAIGFLVDFERLGYVEAVERLAAEAGLPLPAQSPQEAERYKKVLSLQDAVEEAGKWFQQQLTTPAAAEARNYLQHRRISPEMIAAFRLGFAPDSRDALKLHLVKAGFNEAAILEAGLIARSEEGRVYDRFRNRITFPIATPSGKLVAFSGRILPSAEAAVRAKYLNSPETPLFKKGDLLFGLHLARRTISDQNSAIVVEGNLDVVALHQAGFANAIAPLGTAMTAEQLQLLWRVAPEPIMCFDGDNAGKRAMLRAAELALPLMKAGFGLKFAMLPAGEDPDTLIRKQGPAAMQAVLGQAMTLSQLLLATIEARIGTKTPEQRARLEAELMQTADKLADNSLKQHFRDYFRDYLRSLRNPKQRVKDVKKASSDVVALANRSVSTRTIRIEEQICCLVLHHPHILQQADIEEEFARFHFADMQLDKLREAILQHVGSTEATSCETLRSFLATSGLADTSDRIRKQSAALVPKFLRAEHVNMHDVILAWRQILTSHHQATDEPGNDNTRMNEEEWQRFLDRAAVNESRPTQHFVFPEED